MILTKCFVFISNPKTGSTSAEDIIFQAAHLKSLNTPNAIVLVRRIAVKLGLTKPVIRRFLVRGTKGARHKHANCAQIPDSHKALPYIATFREPVQWILSHIRYENANHIAINVLNHRNAPNTIEEKIEIYLKYGEKLRKKHNITNSKVGYFSVHFIIQLHPEPNKIFQDLNDGQRVKFELFSRVHFLNFERQSQDLLFAMNAYGFCQPYLSSLQTNKHLNRSANKSNSDDSKAVINYVSNYEPNLLNWYREFLESTNPRPK